MARHLPSELPKELQRAVNRQAHLLMQRAYAALREELMAVAADMHASGHESGRIEQALAEHRPWRSSGLTEPDS